MVQKFQTTTWDVLENLANSGIFKFIISTGVEFLPSNSMLLLGRLHLVLLMSFAARIAGHHLRGRSFAQKTHRKAHENSTNLQSLMDQFRLLQPRFAKAIGAQLHMHIPPPTQRGESRHFWAYNPPPINNEPKQSTSSELGSTFGEQLLELKKYKPPWGRVLWVGLRVWTLGPCKLTDGFNRPSWLSPLLFNRVSLAVGVEGGKSHSLPSGTNAKNNFPSSHFLLKWSTHFFSG